MRSSRRRIRDATCERSAEWKAVVGAGRPSWTPASEAHGSTNGNGTIACWQGFPEMAIMANTAVGMRDQDASRRIADRKDFGEIPKKREHVS